ncbi:hypothetical protein [Nostoc sp.]
MPQAPCPMPHPQCPMPNAQCPNHKKEGRACCCWLIPSADP